jgi:hypothetical protein
MRYGGKFIGMIIFVIAAYPTLGWAPPFDENPQLCECQKEGYPASTCTSGCGNLTATSTFAGITDSGCYSWAGVAISASCCSGGVPNNAPGCPSSSSVLMTTTQQIIQASVPLALSGATTTISTANTLAGGSGSVLPSPTPVASRSP